MRARRFVCAFLLLALFMGQTAVAETFSNDPAAIQEAAQSVMLLELYCDDECIGTASGFVAFDNKTLITNYHVIEGVTGILAYSDDDFLYYVDRVYAADKDKDLAILGFFSPTNLVPLRLGADAELLRAVPVLTISSPKGIKNSVSKGNISALFEAEGVSYIQISAPISPGSSGGALFDDQGLVIGVLEGALIDAQNMNLAIHIQNAMDLYHTVDAAKFVSLKEFADSIAPAPSPTVKPTLSSNSMEKGDYICDILSTVYHHTEEGIEITWRVLENTNSYFLAYQVDGETESNYLYVRSDDSYWCSFEIRNVVPDVIYRIAVVSDPTLVEDALSHTTTFVSTSNAITKSPYSLLKRGDQGQAVTELQLALIQLGYLDGKADGIYGEETEQAVSSFQKDFALKVCGIAGIATQEKLFAEVTT